MAVYQTYKILFNRSRQGNLLSKMDGRTAYDKAQELLEEMLGGVLPLTKEKRDKTLVPLENYVEKKRDGVTVMVVCNEKNHKYREKLEEHELVYHPGCRVIIDNRPGIAQLAIERSQSFDGKTDKVRDILQEAFCKLFDQYQLTVEIRAKKREVLEPLRGRNVIVYPDEDAYDEWSQILSTMKDIAPFNVQHVPNASGKEDIADFILRKLRIKN